MSQRLVGYGVSQVPTNGMLGGMAYQDPINVTVNNISVDSGTLTVSAGTTALPSISPSGDSNTGIFFPSADTIAFGEGGAEAVRIDSSGRMLVGSTTNRSGSLLQVVSSTPVITVSQSSSDVEIDTLMGAFNVYSNDASTTSSGGIGGIRIFSETAYNSSQTPSYMSFYTHGASTNSATEFGNVGERARIRSNGMFEVKGAGTAGSSPAFSVNGSAPANSAVIDSSGRLGIGTSSPESTLHVAGTIRMSAVPGTNTNAVLPVLFQTSAGNIDGGSGLTYNPGGDDFSVNGNSITASGFRGVGDLGTLTCSNGSGQFDFRATNDSLRFISGSSEAGRFDSGRNLLVGNSSTNIGTGFANKTNRLLVGNAAGVNGGVGAFGFTSVLSGTVSFVVGNNGALRVTIYSTINSTSARIGQYIFVGLNKGAGYNPVVQSTVTNSPNWTFSYSNNSGDTLVTVTAPALESDFQGMRVIVEPLG